MLVEVACFRREFGHNDSRGADVVRENPAKSLVRLPNSPLDG